MMANVNYMNPVYWRAVIAGQEPPDPEKQPAYILPASSEKTLKDFLRKAGGFGFTFMKDSDYKRYKGFAEKPATSECFTAVRYNPKSRLARYTFRTKDGGQGRTYYKQIGPVIAQRWSDAPSLGRHYNDFIKFKYNNTALGKLFYGIGKNNHR